jgi:hypothetical protein
MFWIWLILLIIALCVLSKIWWGDKDCSREDRYGRWDDK